MKTQTKIILTLILLFISACAHSEETQQPASEIVAPATTAEVPQAAAPAATDNTNTLPTSEYDCTIDYAKYKTKLADAQDDIKRVEAKLVSASPDEKAKKQKYLADKQKIVDKYQVLVDRGKARCEA